jgi:peroxiredoxin
MRSIRRHTMKWLVASLSLFVLGFGLARSRPVAESPRPGVDPKEVMEKSAKACQAVKQVEYAEEQVMEGQKTPTLVARIRQARANVPDAGLLPGKFIIEGTEYRSGSREHRFTISYDGSALRMLDSSDKTVEVIKAPTPYVVGGVLSNKGVAFIGMGQFTHDQPFHSLLTNAVRFEHLGMRTIKGTPCHVVSVTQAIEHPALGKLNSKGTWFIGQDDYLPRGNVLGKTEKTLQILRMNGSSGSQSFTVPTPAGYTEKVITGNEPRTNELLPIGSPAPDWTLSDPKGRSHSLKDYRGKVVVLDFWGTWCIPCRKSMPSIQKVHEKYADRGVAVFGASVNDAEGKPAEYMQRQGFTYTLLLKGDKLANTYRARVLPTLYVIGPDGRIFHAEYGLRQNFEVELSNVVERCLEAR